VSRETQVFHFLLSLHHTNNRLENISTFLFGPLQLSSKKNLFLGRKNIGGIFAPLVPPSYAYVLPSCESNHYSTVVQPVAPPPPPHTDQVGIKFTVFSEQPVTLLHGS
jgi:hypothetical protein